MANFLPIQIHPMFIPILFVVTAEDEAQSWPRAVSGKENALRNQP